MPDDESKPKPAPTPRPPKPPPPLDPDEETTVVTENVWEEKPSGYADSYEAAPRLLRSVTITTVRKYQPGTAPRHEQK